MHVYEPLLMSIPAFNFEQLNTLYREKFGIKLDVLQTESSYKKQSPATFVTSAALSPSAAVKVPLHKLLDSASLLRVITITFIVKIDLHYIHVLLKDFNYCHIIYHECESQYIVFITATINDWKDTILNVRENTHVNTKSMLNIIYSELCKLDLKQLFNDYKKVTLNDKTFIWKKV